jgi:hypothetical protein
LSHCHPLDADVFCATQTFVTAVLAFLVSSSFMSVYSVTADTMIFCFIEEDNAKNSPVATRGQSWAYKLLAKAFKDHSIGFKTPEVPFCIQLVARAESTCRLRLHCAVLICLCTIVCTFVCSRRSGRTARGDRAALYCCLLSGCPLWIPASGAAAKRRRRSTPSLKARTCRSVGLRGVPTAPGGRVCKPTGWREDSRDRKSEYRSVISSHFRIGLYYSTPARCVLE